MADPEADELSKLRAEVRQLKTENDCLWASRPFWIFSVREAVRRGDVEEVRANGANREAFVAALQAERDGARNEAAAFRRERDAERNSHAGDALRVKDLLQIVDTRNARLNEVEGALRLAGRALKTNVDWFDLERDCRKVVDASLISVRNISQELVETIAQVLS